MAIKKEVKKTIGNSKRMRTANEHAVTTAVAPAEAIAALRKFKATKFDQTINVVFHLGIDPKAADQALRGSIASTPAGRSCASRTSSTPPVFVSS